MNLTTFKNKTVDLRPYSTNPIFQTPINEECGFCRGPGRKRKYHTLWNLFKHFSYHHPMESWQKIIEDLANKIIRGKQV